MFILTDVHQRQLPKLVLECSNELLTTINYFAKIKTPKKDPIFAGPSGEIALWVNERVGRAESRANG